MLELLNGFVVELRNAGLPVSLTENLDAMEAVQHIPIEDRDAFKYALGATLIKNHAHWRSFDTVFEVYFSLRGPEYRIGDDDGDSDIDEMWREMQEQQQNAEGNGGQGGMDGMTPEEIAQMLMQALMNGDQGMMRAMAKQSVQRFAGMEPGRPVGGTYYLYRTLRNLDLDSMLEKMMDQSRQEAPDDLTTLEERLEKEEYSDRIEKFKGEIEAEIRRRLVADRGAEAMAKTLRKPLPEDVEFMHASRDEMVSLKKSLQPLTRKLAARLARKRKHGRTGCNRAGNVGNDHQLWLGWAGILELRLCRHAAVAERMADRAAEPQFKYPRPSKPELMVIADISGSVAAFARFTLMLVYAISGQFSKVRSFVFIDGLDEVTDYFKSTEDISEAIHRVNTEADVVWVDGHSDYGHAFEVFWNKYGKDITPKTTVLLLGDARNNYHASQSWVVKEIQQKARHVYWLNPEPKSYWNTGDSIVGEYGTFTDGVYECRNLRQLEGFVEKLA
jgi:uncharacterized protein with von Willebrand factor type A (vWA) domain